MRVKLIDLCTPKQWKTLQTSELLEEGYPVYGANGIIGYYSEYNHEKSVIAITCRGATCGTINITVPESYVPGNAMCLDNVRSDVLQKYLYYCLQHYDFNNVISGSAQPQITRQGLEKVEIELCSPEEQRRIITILDNVGAEIAGRKRQNQKLEELIKSRFVELFGSINNQRYPVVKIGSCAKLQGGFAFKSADYLDDGIRLVQISNVNKDTLDWDGINYVPQAFLQKYKDFELHAGDLVLAMTRPVIKSLDAVKIATVSENDVPSLLNQRVGRFVIDKTKLNSVYLMLSCQMPEFREYVEAMSGNSLQPNISSKQVEEYSIVLPPLALQEEFATFVAEVDKSKLAVKQSLEKLETLKKSLMQQYFG